MTWDLATPVIVLLMSLTSLAYTIGLTRISRLESELFVTKQLLADARKELEGLRSSAGTVKLSDLNVSMPPEANPL